MAQSNHLCPALASPLNSQTSTSSPVGWTAQLNQTASWTFTHAELVGTRLTFNRNSHVQPHVSYRWDTPRYR